MYRKVDDGQLEYLGATKSTSYLDSKCHNIWNFYFVFAYLHSDGALIRSRASQYTYCKPTTQDAIPAVQNLQASPLDYQTIQLSWSPVEGVDGYAIYRKTADGRLEYVYITPNTRYTDTEAVRDEYNFYFVFAYRRSETGEFTMGPASKYAFAKPGLPHVTGLRARRSGHTPTIYWNRVNEADGYIIFRMIEDKAGLEYMYLVDKNCLQWTDQNAVRGKINFYFVVPFKIIDGEMVISKPRPYTYSVVPQ